MIIWRRVQRTQFSGTGGVALTQESPAPHTNAAHLPTAAWQCISASDSCPRAKQSRPSSRCLFTSDCVAHSETAHHRQNLKPSSVYTKVCGQIHLHSNTTSNTNNTRHGVTLFQLIFARESIIVLQFTNCSLNESVYQLFHYKLIYLTEPQSILRFFFVSFRGFF